jgi:hypothetical protein
MQSTILSGDTAPERSSLFRGERNVIDMDAYKFRGERNVIDMDAYKEEVAQSANCRPASLLIGSIVTSDELAEAKTSASEALRKIVEHDLRRNADETFVHLWQRATALPVAAVPDVKETQHLLTVPQVLRGGAFIAIGFALLCLIGTMASGATLMHPLLALLVLIAGLGFATMSLFGARS